MLGAVTYVIKKGSAHQRLRATAIKTIANRTFGRTKVYFGGVAGPLETYINDGSRITIRIERTTMKTNTIIAFMKYVRTTTL